MIIGRIGGKLYPGKFRQVLPRRLSGQRAASRASKASSAGKAWM